MNIEQEQVFNKVLAGKNVFITGSAGTGKSFTIGNIIGWANTSRINYGITATTGIAAHGIRGHTIHSFLGIGLALKSAEHLANITRKCKQFVYKRLRKLNLLVIDEISMLNRELFEKISQYLCFIRDNPNPFGGVQIVLCGDFCQLPPVQGDYCFKSELWSELKLECCCLKQCMRQDDHEFVDMLEELRYGKCSDRTYDRLLALKDTSFPSGIEPTVLYSKNVDVDSINTQKHVIHVKSGEDTRVFKTVYHTTKETTKTWANEKRIQEEIELSVRDQVMLTVNMTINSRFYANGTRGVVTGFSGNSVLVQCKHGLIQVDMYKLQDDDDRPEHIVTFMPLKLAYAITIHKSQGMTLDAVVLDLGNSIFEVGQAYTALSRARSLNSIQIQNICKESFQTHPDVIHFYSIM